MYLLIAVDHQKLSTACHSAGVSLHEALKQNSWLYSKEDFRCKIAKMRQTEIGIRKFPVRRG